MCSSNQLLNCLQTRASAVKRACFASRRPCGARAQLFRIKERLTCQLPSSFPGSLMGNQLIVTWLAIHMPLVHLRKHYLFLTELPLLNNVWSHRYTIRNSHVNTILCLMNPLFSSPFNPLVLENSASMKTTVYTICPRRRDYSWFLQATSFLEVLVLQLFGVISYNLFLRQWMPIQSQSECRP